MHHTLRRTATVVALAAGLFGSVISTATADPANGNFPCAPGNSNPTNYCDAKEGDLVDTTLTQLRPTQPSLGHDEVFYKLGRYTKGKDAINKQFDDWCESAGLKQAASAPAGARLSDPSSFTCAVARGSETPATIEPMKTAVVGPHGQLYLTDGHHTFTSFLETAGPNTPVRVRITGNLSKENPAAFWQTMQAKGWTWLRDANDNPIQPNQLPQSLGLANFGNDPYRAALYFARDISYSQGGGAPAFQEFYWGRWLRAQTDPAVNPRTANLNDHAAYLALVRAIATKMVALDGNAQVTDGFTASALGKLPAFDEKEFAKLAKPYEEAKPGKLAYVFAYRG
ncbi:ParB/Srx family N-terminal domain-containing protein [Nocardia camponoti]|uniref:Lipoprotein n=1 Tax=Nocardia camponoti TaxID=1616106 RepID=A0A917QJY7_9NOCA|nr:ParB/Srx family N-terminal domain-containing protein [Nocardia camponoti]GGK53972.1 lipoprotein [Nocardia camponoti]